MNIFQLASYLYSSFRSPDEVIPSYNNEKLLRIVKLPAPHGSDNLRFSHQINREVALIELVKRNLEGRGIQSCVLSEIKKIVNCSDASKIILAYAGDPLMSALAHLRPVYKIKNEFLLKYIRDPQKDADYGDYDIEEQVQLIAALDNYTKTREKKLALQRLYQFYRNQGNFEKCLDVIKNCFKFLFAVPIFTVFPPKTGKLSNYISDEILNVTEKVSSLREKYSTKFIQHYLLDKITDSNFTDMDKIFETLLSTVTDHQVYGKVMSDTGMIYRALPDHD